MVANLVGAGVVLAFAAWIIPVGPLADQDRVLLTNLLVFAGYLAVAVPIGVVWGWRRFRSDRRRWFRGRDSDERRLVLLGPLRLVTVQGVLWGLALVVFGALNAQFSVRLAINVTTTVLLGAVTTCAISYLLSQRALRRSAARVLSAHPPTRQVLPGVAFRAVLFWVLGTAVPVMGVLLVAAGALTYRDFGRGQLAITVIVLAGTALLVGFVVTMGTAKATADPIRAVRRAMGRVQRGDFDVRVAVYDGSELGLLQAGFNRMAIGLAERERIRDLFGRHVGHDVAAEALAGEVELGGEVREVAVLFVDLVGSTTLAATRPPTEVVELLNAFFGIVVEEVDARGGSVNKFEGDAALAVFGAPTGLPDRVDRALATGRELGARLQRELPDTAAGIGITAGRAVAGNIGATRRYEYTVIGDPVNEAARLAELAKSAPGCVVASGAAVELATADGEALRWSPHGSTTLRGRTAVTQLAVPRSRAS